MPSCRSTRRSAAGRPPISGAHSHPSAAGRGSPRIRSRASCACGASNRAHPAATPRHSTRASWSWARDASEREVGMTGTVRELVERRELLYLLVWRELIVKYKQSVMGILWAILMPAVIVAAGIVVKFAFAFVSDQTLNATDIASVAVKAVPWAFFVSSIRFATNSLIANRELVTKVYLPREIFPVASVLSQFVDFAVAAVVLTIVLAVMRVGV